MDNICVLFIEKINEKFLILIDIYIYYELTVSQVRRIDLRQEKKNVSFGKMTEPEMSEVVILGLFPDLIYI